MRETGMQLHRLIDLVNEREELKEWWRTGDRRFLEFCRQDFVRKDDAVRWIRKASQWARNNPDGWTPLEERAFFQQHGEPVNITVNNESGIGPYEVDMSDVEKQLRGYKFTDLLHAIKHADVRRVTRGARGIVRDERERRRRKKKKRGRVWADIDTIRHRREVCLQCSMASDHPEDRDKPKPDRRKLECSACGCILRVKTRAKKESCPIGKWHDVS